MSQDEAAQQCAVNFLKNFVNINYTPKDSPHSCLAELEEELGELNMSLFKRTFDLADYYMK